MYTPATVWLNKLLAQLVNSSLSGGGALSGLYLGLAQMPSATLNPGQGLSALTEATFSGYVRKAVVWSGPYTDAAGQQAVQSASLYFAPTDAVTPNQITMMFLADAATAGNLVLSQVLPGGPVFLSSSADALGISAVFQIPNNANFGDSIIIH